MPESYHEVEARIQEAISAYKLQEEPNLSQIARKFNVPYGRFRCRVKGTVSKSDRPPANMKLNKEQEYALCQWIDILISTRTPPRPKMIVKTANSILRRANPTNPSQVSEKWFPRWIKRHPEYSRNDAGAIERSRTLEPSPETPPSSPSASSWGSTPRTAERVQELRDEIVSRHGHMDVSKGLDKLIRGGIAQAELVDVLKDQLEEKRRLQRELDMEEEEIYRLLWKKLATEVVDRAKALNEVSF